MESAEADRTLRGEVFALIDHPFAAVDAALASPASWCEVLILHPNVAQCRVAPADAGPALEVNFAKRFDESLDQTYRAAFAFRAEEARTDYLRVLLDARKGPVGTSDYRFLLEAMPAGPGKTFVHLDYSYSYGFTAKLATQAYLATKGSDKVGFTVVGTAPDGAPQLIGGMRGAVERNAMRYYLAIDAWLGALARPEEERFEAGLLRWFDAIEEYPRQLAEEDRESCIEVKLRAYERQRSALAG